MATVTVMEYERVVRLVDGRVKDVLGPGRHRYWRRRTHLHRLDLRPRLVTVPGQEMLTADGVSVRVTVVLRTTIADPVRYDHQPGAGLGVYAAAQRAARGGRRVGPGRAARRVQPGLGCSTRCGAADRVGIMIDRSRCVT